MKYLKSFFLAIFLFAYVANAQVTTVFKADVHPNMVRVLWAFTQTTDTTTVFYSPHFSTIPNLNTSVLADFAYYQLAGTNSQFTMKQTKLTATPNTAVVLQGLGGTSYTDTTNASILRAAHVAQTTGDTTATFKCLRVGNDYRIKLTNTGGRITSGFVEIIFTKAKP